jgi:hypothetical protein
VLDECLFSSRYLYILKVQATSRVKVLYGQIQCIKGMGGMAPNKVVGANIGKRTTKLAPTLGSPLNYKHSS